MNIKQYNIEICKRKELGVCCSKGSVTIDWLVDKSGFLPADSIFIEGSIQNDSKQMVAHSSVSLIMVVDCKHKNRRLVDRVRVVHKDGSPVMADDVALWNDVIVVPQCHPSSLDRCKMIEISYELEFKVSLSSNSLLQASTNNAAVNNSTYNNNNNTPYQTIVYNKTIYIGTIPLTTYHHPRPTQSQYAPLPITYPLHTTALVAVQPLPMQALQPTAILIPYYSSALNYGPGSMLAPIHGGAAVIISSSCSTPFPITASSDPAPAQPPSSTPPPSSSSSHLSPPSNDDSVMRVNVEEPHASNPSKEKTDDNDDDNDVGGGGGGGGSGNNNKNIIDDKYSSDNSNFEANNANNETDNNNNSHNDNNDNNSNNDNNNNNNNNNDNNKSGVDNKSNIGDNLKFTLQVIELKKNVNTEKHGPHDKDETSEVDLISINSLCTDLHSTNDRASAPGLMTLLR
ncbi:hypothetical protein HELRODRAFT_163311 [Helobdella robusta]|uniref:Arrestin C-terminal-like domain-containing protein n=1 Tax=Helobdella robusta TaxID=6412 RepID=T1ETW4_HELRO|nr:hypothetical protein HELRODRAFT_163311 [Helobdella robusta]ESN96264.1 hypothetical protein HELRODRAFT_163311 [Helobdella robusta]